MVCAATATLYTLFNESESFSLRFLGFLNGTSVHSSQISLSPPTHTYTHYCTPPFIHSEWGNSLPVAWGKKRCRIWSYHHTARNTQRKAFIWPLPPVLGSLWQERGWWEGWSSEFLGWMKWLGGGEPQCGGLMIFEPPWLAYAKINHINFDRRLRGLTECVCMCSVCERQRHWAYSRPHFLIYFLFSFSQTTCLWVIV